MDHRLRFSFVVAGGRSMCFAAVHRGGLTSGVALSLVLLCLCGCDLSPTLDRQPAGKISAATKSKKTTQSTVAPLPDPPDLQFDWVFQPRIHTVFGSAKSGTCFAVHLEPTDDTLLLTSQSLIGREGGILSDFRPSRLGEAVFGVELHSLTATPSPGGISFSPLVTLPSGWYEPAGDVAAIVVQEGSGLPSRGRLSIRNVRAGNTAWLVAADSRTPDSTAVCHPVTIEQGIGAGRAIAADHF